MGICRSCDAAAVGPLATAKLILADGELREFEGPVRVSSLIKKDSSEWFVCDADEMELDAYVSAVGSDEELRPGQIYFVLPRSMLKRPLHAEDLAALAVKASSALMNRRAAEATPLVFGVGSKNEGVKKTTTAAAEKRRRRRSRSGRGRSFVTDLTAIPE